MSSLMILCCFKVLPGGIESTKISGNHLGFVCLRWFFLRIAIPINVFQCFFTIKSHHLLDNMFERNFFSIRIEESQNPRLVGLNVSIGRLDFFFWCFTPLFFVWRAIINKYCRLLVMYGFRDLSQVMFNSFHVYMAMFYYMGSCWEIPLRQQSAA